MWNPPEIEYILLLFPLISIEAIQGNIHTHIRERDLSLMVMRGSTGSQVKG